jgi:hypothetical protein
MQVKQVNFKGSFQLAEKIWTRPQHRQRLLVAGRDWKDQAEGVGQQKKTKSSRREASNGHLFKRIS